MAAIITSNNQALDHQQDHTGKILQSNVQHSSKTANEQTNSSTSSNKTKNNHLVIEEENNENGNNHKIEDAENENNDSSQPSTNATNNKKLSVVLPTPSQKTLVTPTIVTSEPCATPSQLFSSLIQLNGQEVGLFTGLPSCTPTSADSIAGGINPFFWGVSAFNQESNNQQDGNAAETTSEHAQQQQQQQNSNRLNCKSKQSSENGNASSGSKLQQANETNLNGSNKHQLSKLSLDQIQAANAILSPLSLFISPEGLRFVGANQHPLASFGADLACQTNEQILNSAPNQEAAPVVAAQDLTSSNNAATLANHHEPSSGEQHQQQLQLVNNCSAVSSSINQQPASTVTYLPPRVPNQHSCSHQQNRAHFSGNNLLQNAELNTEKAQQQQQHQANQISQSIYNNQTQQANQHLQHHMLQNTTNPHQVSLKTTSNHSQLVYHHHQSVATTLDGAHHNHLQHLHHHHPQPINQHQQQVAQQQLSGTQHVGYAPSQPVLSIQCKQTPDRHCAQQGLILAPPVAHHQQAQQQQMQLQHHHQPQQMFVVNGQQADSRLIEFHNQQAITDRVRQATLNFPYDPTGQTTIGIYQPHFRQLYLAQQQQPQSYNTHSQQPFQGYQVGGCNQPIQRVATDQSGILVAPTSLKRRPEAENVSTVTINLPKGKVTSTSVNSSLQSSPNNSPAQSTVKGSLGGSLSSSRTSIEQDCSTKPDIFSSSSTSTLIDCEFKDKNKSLPESTTTTGRLLKPLIDAQSTGQATKVKRLKKTQIQTKTELPSEDGVVKKKSKGGRKKKLITHEELMARKNRSKERNRVAAKRCRLKRKRYLDELCSHIDNLNDSNKKLQKENTLLKNELELLKQHHLGCEI